MSCIHFPLNKILTWGEKNFNFEGEYGPFSPLKRGVTEDDDRTIKQDELRE